MDFPDELPDRPSKPRWLQLAAELDPRPEDKRQRAGPKPAEEAQPRVHDPLRLAPVKNVKKTTKPASRARKRR